MKKTAVELQNIQDRELFLTIENDIRGGNSSVMPEKIFISDEELKSFHIDAINLYGWAMSQPLS